MLSATRRLGRSLDLDGRRHRRLHGAVAQILDTDQRARRTHPRADGYWCREANLVQAVVDCQLDALDGVHLVLQAREQRQGHESVRDGGAKGTRSGPFRVDVDPLVITRCVGEQIDLFLGDGHPVALPDLFARGGARSATDSKVRMGLSSGRQ